MKKKNKDHDEFTLYLPAPGFKKRFMPPMKLSVNPGDWTKQPLYLSSLKVSEREELTFFDLKNEEVIL